ncbi:MAG: helix-turn-helix domain-containing protein [Saprospiraceae bacterium]|nr:helix-turn-helix domain-containing protein [Saprospiraceae bacterium]
MKDFDQVTGFVYTLAKVVIGALDNADLSVADLSKVVHLSREQVHRKLKAETGLSTGKFIRYIRLLFALQHLSKEGLSVQEIGYKVGFNNPGYFIKCFKEAWKITPGEISRQPDFRPDSELPIVKFYLLKDLNHLLVDAGVHIESKSTVVSTPERKWSHPFIIYPVVFLIAAIITTKWIRNYQQANKVINLQERLAVIPFINNTGDTLQKQIGDIASSWISSQIDGLDNIRTVPFFTIKQYEDYLGVLPGDVQKRPTFGEVVGAKYILQGYYFLKDDQLYFDTELIDAQTMQLIYHLPMVSGSVDQTMELIETVRLKIAGLLTNLQEVYLGKLTPPGLDAYESYLKGLQAMGKGDFSVNTRNCFEKAIELEPDFVMPHLYRLWFYSDSRRDSIVAEIERLPKMTDYEARIFKHLKLRFNHKYHEDLVLSLEMIRDYPKDYYFNTMAAHEAKSQFMPNLAIEILSTLQDPLQSDAGLMWHYFKVRNYTESLMALGKYEEALDYLQNIPGEFFNSAIPESLIIIKVALGQDVSSIDSLINSYHFDDNKFVADLYAIAAYEFTLIDKMSAALFFIEKASMLMKNTSERKGHGFDLVDLYFISGHLNEAKSELNLSKSQRDDDYWAYLCFIEAAQGHAEQALQIFEKELSGSFVLWRRNVLEYQPEYIKARIFALLGEKDKAISALQLALKRGQLCHHLDFGRDIFLKSLFGVSQFEKVIEPKDYTGDVTIVE